MPATADNLRDLHMLHQRAKALRDRMTSGPKTVAARELAQTNRQAALEAARKALQESRVHLKTKEHTVQSLTSKQDDYKVKLNSVKKNEEYKAIQNEIALLKHQVDKIEGEMLEEMEKVDEQARKLASDEADYKRFTAEVAALKADVDAQVSNNRAQLAELETAIVDAEAIIPVDVRDRYRRTVKQLGSDAMAHVEFDRKSQMASCTGCFVSLTTQGLNELMNGHHMTFCQTCGRVLYLPEENDHYLRAVK
jgi:uncharacterized protein